MPTPWQKVHKKFEDAGFNSSRLADAIGRHRSKISRAIEDGRGLINGVDMILLLDAAEDNGITLTLEDFKADE